MCLPPQDGVHYHFVTKADFEHDIAHGKFLEYARVHGNIYGTSLAAVQDVAASGKCCVLDIDVQVGSQRFRTKLVTLAVVGTEIPRIPLFVFILAASQELTRQCGMNATGQPPG